LDEWLRRIGGNDDLADYAKALREEGFNSLASLKNLEEEDFDAMKITKRGHRRAIMAGVQELKAKSA